MPVDNSVQNAPLVSDERLREVLRRHIHSAIHLRKVVTRTTLAAESGVNVHTIDAILSRQIEKHRRVAIEDAFSIACVLGEKALNALLATIGYGGARPLDEPDAMQPVDIVTNAMQQLGRLAKCAADNLIDHSEEPEATDAADSLIATVLPLSSAGRAA